MRHNATRQIPRLAIVTIAIALSAACARPSAYKAPVMKFRDASAVVIESTKAYLLALNKTERDHYINDQVASRAPILLIKIEEVQVFGAEAIAVRLDALDQLANYTELLYRLATSDAPETIKGKATDLGTAISNLSGEINGLTGADDAGFKKAATTVFPVIGDVLKAVVEQQLEDALKKAAATGAGPVNTLIDAIRSMRRWRTSASVTRCPNAGPTRPSPTTRSPRRDRRPPPCAGSPTSSPTPKISGRPSRPPGLRPASTP